MRERPVKIAVVPNLTKEAAQACTDEVLEILSRCGCETVLKTDLFTAHGLYQERVEDSLRSCDLFIAIGGDGTIIHTAKLAASMNKPILGVNAGKLGFTAGVERHELSLLSRLIRGEYREERRLMLAVELDSAHGSQKFYALNDAVLARGALSKILDFRVLLNESNVGDYRADGLIVSTPTGSTAYSLSAGGPVIDPALRCLLLSPICPHSLFTRPVVFGEDSLLQIQAGSSEQGVNCYLTVDGQISGPLKNDEPVRCRAASRTAKLIKLKDINFYEVVNHKLAERRS